MKDSPLPPADSERSVLILDKDIVAEIDGSLYPHLQKLECSGRQCEHLDLLDNADLEELNCSVNNLISLDLSGCSSLRSLDCSLNALEELTLPAASDLEVLDAADNRLTHLDLSGASDLKELYLEGNLELSSLEWPTDKGDPITLEILTLNQTNLSSEWFESHKEAFPLPEEPGASLLLLDESPLETDDSALAFVHGLGWITEEYEEE